ncbi:RsmB/NOP family class I SAM-dependent RNA methyltransferase [Chlamydiifrater phoenicopteri]|uniref:RsmB/NOP family class I SAM-dependent RNA methyltransferase n=1 Tax=Chlamydiifrater phoenicopteri TaxID=2681469 RepID=UPI001BCCF8EB|nr:RsmB/NOP family class I SAM-dependent RNA methyltransferase [Chlamydiifrater phoenicopteri]
MIPFRLYHLHRVLEEFFIAGAAKPSDKVLAQYFKVNKSLGAKDRKFINLYFYQIIRNYLFLKSLLEKVARECSVENLCSFVLENNIEALRETSSCPQAVRYSVSDDFLTLLKESYSEKYVRECLNIFLEEAPISIRVNARKCSPEQLLRRWEGRFIGKECLDVPGAILLAERYPLQSTKEFREGWFEFQDLSSQKISREIPMTSSDIVLDYCAGAGGKSLVFVETASQVLLHDVREKALQQAYKRLVRSGNSNFLITGKDYLNEYVGKCHVVVVDAPCSGSGTFRRHPEGKWLLSLDKVSQWTALQRSIVEEAKNFVCNSGRLVYATCSILPQENEEQKEFFIKTYGWKVEKETKLLPVAGSGDGMYSVIFKV